MSPKPPILNSPPQPEGRAERQKPTIGAFATRDFSVRTRATTVDTENRTAELAFSSEMHVETWWVTEILSHASGAMMLDRLNDGAALLDGHAWDRQVGVIQTARNDADRVGRATVRFSRIQAGEDMMMDVADGIRTKVSVGYLIHEVVENSDTNPPTFTVTRWEPYEISVVSVPADPSVGVGRSLFQSARTAMSTDTNLPFTPPDPATLIVPAVSASGDNERALQGERQRCARILKLGEQFGQTAAAQRYISEGKSFDDFSDFVIAERAKNPQKPMAHLDMSRQDRQHYSILRALNAYVTRDWDKAGFERECSVEISNRLGREARGFFVPMDIAYESASDQIRRRAMSVGSDVAGGYLVDTENMYEYGVWINNLRPKAVCLSMGATLLDGLVGDLSIPRKTASASFYWVGEDEDVTLSDPQLGAVQLRNRTIAGGVPLTRKLLMQTSRAVESLVRDDMILGAALGIDKAIISGGGGKEPLGLYSAANLGSQSIASPGAPTWAETVGFETSIATANALAGNLAYLAHTGVRGVMKTTSKAGSYPVFIWGDNNQVNGYAANATTQMPTNGLLFGDWSSVIVGFWGVLDLKPDEATKAASGGLVLRIFQDADVALRHPEAFCKNA